MKLRNAYGTYIEWFGYKTGSYLITVKKHCSLIDELSFKQYQIRFPNKKPFTKRKKK